MKDNKTEITHAFMRFTPKMRMVARLMLGDSDEAEDAVGDVFADVATGRIDVSGDKAEGMLITCLRNRCLNILRRKTLLDRIKGRMQIDDHVDITPPERQMGKLEEILDFIDKELTPQTARVIRMHYSQKMKYREISEELGISEAAVYKHLAQGIRKLKERFNNDY